MISYDNYKNRIEKMAKVKRGLHKFRFLICGVLALIVGVTVGLMCAKGSYTSGMSLSAQTVIFTSPKSNRGKSVPRFAPRAENRVLACRQ